METSRQNLDSLQVLQNRACRIILKLLRLSPTADMHSELKLMMLDKRRMYHLNTFTFKSQHGLLPRYISSKIYPKRYDHDVMTRLEKPIDMTYMSPGIGYVKRPLPTLSSVQYITTYCRLISERAPLYKVLRPVIFVNMALYSMLATYTPHSFICTC